MTLHAALAALALFVFHALGFGRAPDARGVAEDIATAVLEEASPASGESHALDAALEALYVARESGVQRFPRPYSDDAKDGRSCSYLQLPCAFVRTHTRVEQLRYWLELVRGAGLASVDSSPARAGRRLRLARRLLTQALADGGP